MPCHAGKASSIHAGGGGGGDWTVGPHGRALWTLAGPVHMRACLASVSQSVSQASRQSASQWSAVNGIGIGADRIDRQTVLEPPRRATSFRSRPRGGGGGNGARGRAYPRPAPPRPARRRISRRDAARRALKRLSVSRPEAGRRDACGSATTPDGAYINRTCAGRIVQYLVVASGERRRRAHEDGATVSPHPHPHPACLPRGGHEIRANRDAPDGRDR